MTECWVSQVSRVHSGGGRGWKGTYIGGQGSGQKGPAVYCHTAECVPSGSHGSSRSNPARSGLFGRLSQGHRVRKCPSFKSESSRGSTEASLCPALGQHMCVQTQMLGKVSFLQDQIHESSLPARHACLSHLQKLSSSDQGCKSFLHYTTFR